MARPQLFPEIRVGQIERAHSKKLFAAIAGNDLAGTVYIKEALAVMDVDGRGSGFGDGAELAFALRQRALTLLSLGGFHRECNQICHRGGEVFFLHSPLPSPTHLLVAHHPDEASCNTDRGIQGCCDVIGQQVVV